MLHCLNILFRLCPFHFAFISYFSTAWMACWAFPGSEELSGEISRSTQTVQAAAVLLLHGCSSTIQSTVYLPKGTGRVGERRYTLCQAWFLSLNTSQRIPKARILAANLCRSPHHHTSAVSLHCSSKSGAANVHHARGFGAGCVSDTLGLQDDTALLTTSSMFTQEQRWSHSCMESSILRVVWAALP